MGFRTKIQDPRLLLIFFQILFFFNIFHYLSNFFFKKEKQLNKYISSQLFFQKAGEKNKTFRHATSVKDLYLQLK